MMLFLPSHKIYVSLLQDLFICFSKDIIHIAFLLSCSQLIVKSLSVYYLTLATSGIYWLVKACNSLD